MATDLRFLGYYNECDLILPYSVPRENSKDLKGKTFFHEAIFIRIFNKFSGEPG
jgi:hypothetical protein